MSRSITHYLTKHLPENNQWERIWILAKTDFKLRYYETTLGLIWAFLHPIIRMVIYWVVFSYILNQNIPNYGMYIFSGLIVWTYFQEATRKGLMILRNKRYLYENIRMNPYDGFTSSVLSTVINLAFNVLVFVALSPVFDIAFSFQVLWIFPILLNLVVLVYAISLILAVLNSFLKDISQVWDVFLLGMFWINPIFYAKTLIFESFPALMYINPIAGIIVNLRDALMYAQAPDMSLFWFDWVYAFALLGIGMWVFNSFFHKAMEKL
ncbi:MAG: ABC transporter permease [Bacteroidales bacterium]|nr:ABC transporter permease [Bacteroidales bacterium]